MIQREIMGTKLTAKLWLNEVEDSCMEQIVRLASLPYAFHHIAIMPDAHTGVGMPIGGVLATKGVVVPNAVGVDIGCGMCAVRTTLKASELERKDITSVMSYIRKNIPLGFDHRKTPMDESLLPEADFDKLPYLKGMKAAMLCQLGTLGGGNHFIEIQKDVANDDVWIMIHSGSRNVGLSIAKQYAKIAVEWCSKWYSETQPGLEFLPIEFEEGKKYLREMEYCKQFALANRKVMMDFIMEGFRLIKPNVEFGDLINIAHNYAAYEHHFGENVIVHRKGATRARMGEIGIIPGSMGTKSYIVEGLGNVESFESCSHGAGRRLSRAMARETLSLEEECRKMDERGIIHGMRRDGLDEAPGAYKDIDRVMQFESDLVKPIVELLPIAVIKG